MIIMIYIITIIITLMIIMIRTILIITIIMMMMVIIMYVTSSGSKLQRWNGRFPHPWRVHTAGHVKHQSPEPEHCSIIHANLPHTTCEKKKA